jgi:site-specific DNA-methyltransferase (adenine-specific)
MPQPYTLIHGNCLEHLPNIPDQSIDAVISDPPYAEINRDYGRFPEAEWHGLMEKVVSEVRRILKPQGSAVFVLQPNHETPGRVRPWLWEFMAKYSREWNMPQDVWWWNPTCMPTTHCSRKYGLMRPSVKACVWLGPVDCYRNQDAILWEQSEANKAHKLEDRALKKYPSGSSMREGRCIEVANERGGSTPLNLIPLSSGSVKRRGTIHGATTPLKLCEWWANYITPPSGTILDPFSGTATVGEAALLHGYHYIGIEQYDAYHEEAVLRLAEVTDKVNASIL